MESPVTSVPEKTFNNDTVKVHRSMCGELTKVLTRTGSILPAIEAARPGCKEGIQELCALYNTINKGKLIIQHCTECSKLYLAVTGETILLRCERIRSSLNRSMMVIRSMVPLLLASQILDLVNQLNEVKFSIDSVDEEAGQAILELLRQPNATQDDELKMFQLAALKLNLRSSKALLIEKRAVKKLLDKTTGVDPKKEGVLKFFLYLFTKYGTRIKLDAVDSVHGNDYDDIGTSNGSESVAPLESRLTLVDQIKEARDISTPKEFRCPLSGEVMKDPVIFASGQTYDRKSIEKWFSSGNSSCPVTQMKLENYSIIPNLSMRDLISNWYQKQTAHLYDGAYFNSIESSHSHSISSMANISAPLVDKRAGDYAFQSDHSNISVVSSEMSCSSYHSDSTNIVGTSDTSSGPLLSTTNDQTNNSFSNMDYGLYMKFFKELCGVSSEVHLKSVEEFAIKLESDDMSCHAMLSNGFANACIDFMKDSFDQHNIRACRVGAQFFLAFLKNSRFDIPSMDQDAFSFIASLLKSDLKLESLLILHELVQHQKCNFNILASITTPSVMEVLGSGDLVSITSALKIICELSSDSRVKPLLISSNFVSLLAQLLGIEENSEYCLRVLRNLVDAQAAISIIVGVDGCISSVAEILDTGNRQEQEHAVAVLYAICTQSMDNRLLVMKEGVIPSLVDLSVNGYAEGKEIAFKLLHLLRDLRQSDPLKNSVSRPSTGSGLDNPGNLVGKQQISRSSRFPLGKMKLFFRA